MKDALTAYDTALTESSQGRRLEAVRRAARTIRDRLLEETPVLSVRTLPLTTLPYPSAYAFQGAALSPVPIVQLSHRCLLVQFLERGAPRTLLFNPTDIVGARATPYFADFIRMIGAFEPLVAKRSPTLESQLNALALTPAHIDYVAFDHFHTQDLRSLLGKADGSLRPRFPNGTLLAPRSEWNDWDALHPMQRAWYVHDGKRGVIEDRVRLGDGSLHLGSGVVLLQTPGHTSGNQTLLVRTAEGIWGCSENGTAADCWSPSESRIPGVARFAKKFDLEVIINSNTPELGAAQYASMIAERTIVDSVPEARGFVRMFPSSEVIPSLLAPGLAPTWRHHEIRSGEVVVVRRSPKEAAARAPL